jgi:hypothetical protein
MTKDIYQLIKENKNIDQIVSLICKYTIEEIDQLILYAMRMGHINLASELLVFSKNYTNADN